MNCLAFSGSFTASIHSNKLWIPLFVADKGFTFYSLWVDYLFSFITSKGTWIFPAKGLCSSGGIFHGRPIGHF